MAAVPSSTRQTYVTTPIFYVNDAPHIGHAYTTIIADAYARWRRLCGDDAMMLTGTDEHGLKVQRAAAENGCTPIEWADRTVVRFQQAWEQLDIGYGDFIRTSEPRHHAAVRRLLQACYDNGDITLQTYEGLYCVSCEAYYTPADLDDGRCRIHQRPAEHVSEENYFFALSRYEQRLLELYESRPDFVMPATKRNEALGFIRSGLQDFSISRTSIDWGVPLPWDDRHVAYVWFDALTSYITAAGYGSDDDRFARRWPGIHLIGKDIIRFHCVYWPAMLMSAGVEPPAHVYVHGFLLVGGEKMAKSALNQIAPGDLVAEFGTDGVRHHFLHDQAFGPDGDFSYEAMLARYNADLANNFGNLLSRVSTLVVGKCGGVGPAPQPDSALATAAAACWEAAAKAWDEMAPSEALDAVWRLIRETNAALEKAEPWKLEPGPAVDAVLGDALEVLRLVAVLTSAAMPESCAQLWRRIGLSGRPDDERLPAAAQWGGYPGGLAVERGEPLFPRLG
ncbi:MAG TPA: methionine--tRNA ligase [Acidimicrobiaceae bacterium]|nr:methionine--tRNA ligase [Acidimicrobiaceae bacterium]HCB37332.1 methionine--tRNA ligase [Acidimicrobiaceae bacterium]